MWPFKRSARVQQRIDKIIQGKTTGDDIVERWRAARGIPSPEQWRENTIAAIKAMPQWLDTSMHVDSWLEELEELAAMRQPLWMWEEDHWDGYSPEGFAFQRTAQRIDHVASEYLAEKRQ